MFAFLLVQEQEVGQSLQRRTKDIELYSRIIACRRKLIVSNEWLHKIIQYLSAVQKPAERNDKNNNNGIVDIEKIINNS